MMEIEEEFSSTEEKDKRERMLRHISLNEEAHFKSQQRNEPDLTTEEKRQIALEILNRSPGRFLSRFGKYLDESHLEYFNDMTENDYEVNYYLSELKKKFQTPNSKSLIRNRRLEALRRLHEETEYFSDEEMRKRNPLLYEDLVGQYLTEEEKQLMHADRIASKSFTGIILNAIDEREVEDRLKSDKENERKEEERLEEEEHHEKRPIEDLSDESCDYYPQVNTLSLWGEYTTDAPSQAPSKLKKRKKKKKEEPLTEEEKSQLMNEFRSHMYTEFISGKDSEFDYSQVDSNADYDDLDMVEYDQQDKYFDEESPEIISEIEDSTDSNYMSSIPPPKTLEEKMAELET